MGKARYAASAKIYDNEAPAISLNATKDVGVWLGGRAGMREGL